MRFTNAFRIRQRSNCKGTIMSHGVKLTLFMLAFNAIAFAEAYLLRDLGLVWLVPIVLVTGLESCC